MNKYILIIFLFFNLLTFDSYSSEVDKIYNKQWETVLELQRIIDNDILSEAPKLFSKRVKNKISIIIKKDPSFFKKSWYLTDEKIKLYKKNVFSGKGLFILEDNIWKIDEI